MSTNAVSNSEMPMNEMSANATPMGDFSVAADPTLQQGDSGVAVVELQKLLNARGANLIVDGVFGAVTRAAVVQFQQRNNLIADGIVGRFTWAKLRQPVEAPISLINVCRYYKPNQFPYQTSALNWLQWQLTYANFREFIQRWENTAIFADPLLQMGSYGAAVYEMQVMLNKAGATLVTDGNFGATTRAAVVKFQQQNKLTADGMVADATWAKLREIADPRYLRTMFAAYDGVKYPYQTTALEWLQSKISATTLNEFARRYRNQPLPAGN